MAIGHVLCNSVVVDSLLIVAPIVCGGYVGPCLVMHYLVPFLFCNRISVEERVGCFILIVFCYHAAVSVLCFFAMVLWVGLWSVIPGRTHFLFDRSVENEQTWKMAIFKRTIFAISFSNCSGHL